MTSKGKLAEQSVATRTKLAAAARELFAERGYAGTTTEDIVKRARVTRGALYHHFESKDEVFTAVYETMEAELAQRSMIAAAHGTTPLEMIHLGIDAFLDACLEPDVQRIVLMEAVSVLGWETWHEIGVRYNFGILRAGLEAAMHAGEIEPRPVETLAHLVQGALMRAGMVVARAADPAAARGEMGEEIRNVLASLRPPPAARPRSTRRRAGSDSERERRG